MLKISKNEESIVLEEIDPYKESQLRKSLHKLFLKKYVNGYLDEDNSHWIIPYKSIEILLLIINHFNKYGLDFICDINCELLLKEHNNKEEEFKLLIKAAIKAKLEYTTASNKKIDELLKPEFIRPLTEYQYRAVNHLLTIKNGANFSVPGSGKTTMALAYYHILKKLKQIDKLFIIGPASIFEPWETEYRNCFDKNAKSSRIAGNQRIIRKSIYLKIQDTEIFLNTYHSSARDINEIKSLLKQKRFLLILDESHYVKKPQGGKLAETILELSKYATRRLILTGTPMPNGLSDLWSQISFLWIDKLPLGTANQYLNKISIMNNETLIDAIKTTIFPYFFRITKSQLDLPTPFFHLERCKMSPVQSLIYKGVASKFLTELDFSYHEKQLFRELRRARSIRLLQIASNPTLLRINCDEFLVPPLDTSNMDMNDILNNYSNIELPNKISYTVDLAKELIQKGEKIVIWSMFVHNLHMLNKLLIDFNPVVVYGGIPYTKDDEIESSREVLIHKFKTDVNCKILLANPAACAESISLHKICHNAIYLDRSFNCAHYIQSLDRIHRLGLKKDDIINYYIIKSEGTIDDIVDLRLNQKIDNMHHIIEGDLPGSMPGYWNNDLGEEEILDFDLVDNHIRQLFS